MNNEESKLSKENSEIVIRNCRILWDNIMKDTEGFSDARTYLIASRITGYMVARVYSPAVTRAISDTMAEGSFK